MRPSFHSINWLNFDYYCFRLKESPSPRPNGDHNESRDSIGLNGNDKPGGSNSKTSAERPPSRSGSSSSRSTPSLKTKDVSFELKVSRAHDSLLIYLFICSRINQEHQVQKDDQPPQMPVAFLLVRKMQFLQYRPVIQIHRIKDYHMIRMVDRHLIIMEDHQFRSMHMYEQMVCHYHIQEENRKFYFVNNKILNSEEQILMMNFVLQCILISHERRRNITTGAISS